LTNEKSQNNEDFGSDKRKPSKNQEEQFSQSRSKKPLEILGGFLFTKKREKKHEEI